MKYFKKIAGEKVYLSPINIEDAEIYTKWLNDWETVSLVGGYQRVFTLAAEKEALENLSHGQHYAIVRAYDDVLLGNCGLNHVDHIQRTAELGIFIGDPENCGKGYGTEAVKLLVDYGFKTLNLRNIMLRHHADNERAHASYVKAGFREFGRRSGACYKNRQYVDDVYMEILSDGV